jgi:hypothetical protein
MRITKLSCIVGAVAVLGCPAKDPGEEETQTDGLATATSPTTTVGTTESTGPATTDDSDSQDTADAESGSTSGEPTDPCGVGRACLDPPPLGWIGPVVVARGDMAEALPGCTDPYPGNELTRLEGFNDPGPAECECACAFRDGGCNGMYTSSGAASCSSFLAGAEGCFQLPTPLTDGYLNAYSYANGVNSCDQAATEIIPEIPWDAIVKGCTGSGTEETCDTSDRICYELPAEGFEQQICYLAEGDVPCPPDTDFVEKTIRFSSVDDTRECTACVCGSISSCAPEYEYYETSDCSGSPAGTVPNQVCTENVTAAAVNFDFSETTCPVTSMSEPEGEITTNDPWTYCCATP